MKLLLCISLSIIAIASQATPLSRSEYFKLIQQKIKPEDFNKIPALKYLEGMINMKEGNDSAVLAHQFDFDYCRLNNNNDCDNAIANYVKLLKEPSMCAERLRFLPAPVDQPHCTKMCESQCKANCETECKKMCTVRFSYADRTAYEAQRLNFYEEITTIADELKIS